MAQEKKAYGTIFQGVIHPDFKISNSFLKITLYSVNNILPDIFCQSLNVQNKVFIQKRQNPPYF